MATFCGFEYIVNFVFLQKAINVMPASSAFSIAKEDGAETAARKGILANRVLFTISNEMRPLTVIHLASLNSLLIIK